MGTVLISNPEEVGAAGAGVEIGSARVLVSPTIVVLSGSTFLLHEQTSPIITTINKDLDLLFMNLSSTF
jgi:hypothetical protein